MEFRNKHFRYRPKMGISYGEQGYIHFASMRYKKLPKSEQEEIEKLFREAGGEYYEALKTLMTTDKNMANVCMTFYVSESTLHRCVERYFKLFAKRIS